VLLSAACPSVLFILVHIVCPVSLVSFGPMNETHNMNETCDTNQIDQINHTGWFRLGLRAISLGNEDNSLKAQ